MPYGDGWQMNDVVMSYRSASSVTRMLRKWCVSIPFKRPVSCAFAVKEVMSNALHLLHCNNRRCFGLQVLLLLSTDVPVILALCDANARKHIMLC